MAPALTIQIKAPTETPPTAGWRMRIFGGSDDPAAADVPPAPYGYFADALAAARKNRLVPADRPRLFIVEDAVQGPASDNAGTAVETTLVPAAIETLALLGVNTLRLDGFGNQTQFAHDIMTAWNITRHGTAFATAPAWFTWSDGADGTSLATWAAGRATVITDSLQVPLAHVVIHHMDDEPEWWQADTTTLMLASATAKSQFQTYLEDQGFSPSDFGGTVWTDVLPIPFADVDGTVETHRLFYWTQRFVIHSYFTQQVANTAALRAAVNPDLYTTLNYHNWVSRWYSPATATQTIQSTGPGAHEGLISPEWLAYGPLLSGGAHWTEDWFDNPFADLWSLYATALRSAAQLNGATFGGYVVGLKLQDGHPHGGMYKALTLLGKGAKALMWYTFGPQELFPGNGWSSNPEAFPQIAAANQLIARAEDLMFPGAPLASDVAIILPLSTQVWDVHTGSVIDALQIPNWSDEVYGLYYALMHRGYQVDLLSEYDVATRIDNYQAVYVVGPNLAAAAQSALATWISAGGVAWFSAGSAVRDEYDQATTTLNATRGITAQGIPTQYIAEDSLLTQAITRLDVTVGGQRLAAAGADEAERHLERLTVTTATVLATFDDDDGPALVAHQTGSGWAISCGYQLGNQYFSNTSYSPTALRTGWTAVWREMISLAPRLAGVARAVDVDREVVEAARLDSAGGIAITLLNWTGAAIPPVTVTAHNCPPIARAVLARSLTTVDFTQVAGDVTVTVPLPDVEVLKLYAV